MHQREPADGQAEAYAEDSVSGDSDHDEAQRHRDAEHLWIGRKEHSQFDQQGHYDCPYPMAARRVADNGDVHDAEGRAVAEMVKPAKDLRGEAIRVLLDRLAEDHRAEAREDFEKVHGRDDRGNSPFPRENEGETEDVISHSSEQARAQADEYSPPKLAVAAFTIQGREENQAGKRRQENEWSEDAHRTKVIEIRKEAGDGRSGEQKDDPASTRVPMGDRNGGYDLLSHDELLAIDEGLTRGIPVTRSRPADAGKGHRQTQFAAGMLVGKDDFDTVEMFGRSNRFR